ncbi:MAG: solute carrier family 26 protein [Cyclobacteriaceae bacterium]
MRKLSQLLPVLSWLPNYQKSWLKGDISAGLTVGVMLIPQGMAYALIAGLPPVYGLYAAIVPQLIYAFFGTSRQLSVGPVAMDSLLVASGVSVMAVQGTEAYLSLVILLTVFTGIFQLFLGVIKMGFVTNLLSKPVISGFTSAAAFIIGVNQLNHLLGIDLVKSNQVLKVLSDVPTKIDQTHMLTLGIGLTTLLLIYFLKKWKQSFPGALTAVILSSLVVYFGGLSEQNVSILAQIPAGLPSFQIPVFSYQQFVELVPLALTLAVISFMESYSVSKSLESKRHEYKVEANQELVALGLSNMGGAFFGSFPVAGGFSRSAVNFQSGARTPLANVISASLIIVTLLFLTSWFYYLPHAVLGAIILVAISGLIDLKYAAKLWHDSKLEFWLMVFTLLSTIVFSMVIGIITGIVLSVLVLMYQLAYPHIAELGRLKGHHEFRNVKRFKDLETWDHIMIIRLDASLRFININYFKEYIERKVIERKSKGLNTIILDAGPISNLDATASAGLLDLLIYLNENGIEFLICDVIGPVRDSMKRSGLNEKIRKEHVFLDLNEAVRFAITHEQGEFKEYALQAND